MMLDGVACGSYSRGDPDLAIYRGQVRIVDARTDDHAFGHLVIGQALCHHAQHLDLPGRQPIRIGWRRVHTQLPKLGYSHLFCWLKRSCIPPLGQPIPFMFANRFQSFWPQRRPFLPCLMFARKKAPILPLGPTCNQYDEPAWDRLELCSRRVRMCHKKNRQGRRCVGMGIIECENGEVEHCRSQEKAHETGPKLCQREERLVSTSRA